MIHRFLKFGLCALALAAMSLEQTQADLVANGDFTAATLGNSQRLEFQNVDQGWFGRGPGWVLDGATAAFTNPTLNGSGNGNRVGLAQASSITTETGADYTLSFDWTPAAAGGSLDLNYIAAAWVEGATPGATDRLFNSLTLIDTRARQAGTGGSITDLVDGSVHTGDPLLDAGTLTGTAGVQSSGSLALNFGGSNIEDFDFIAVKFWVGDGTVAGGTLDNVVIANTSAVPEPSSLALFGLCGLGLALRRKRA